MKFEQVDGSGRLPSREATDELEFVAMMKSVLETDSFFFATNYEVTHTLQREYPCLSLHRPHRARR